MKERKRKHDDAHFPLGGRGKRANRYNPVPRTAELVPWNPNQEMNMTDSTEALKLVQEIDHALVGPNVMEQFDDAVGVTTKEREKIFALAALLRRAREALRRPPISGEAERALREIVAVGSNVDEYDDKLLQQVRQIALKALKTAAHSPTDRLEEKPARHDEGEGRDPDGPEALADYWNDRYILMSMEADKLRARNKELEAALAKTDGPPAPRTDFYKW